MSPKTTALLAGLEAEIAALRVAIAERQRVLDLIRGTSAPSGPPQLTLVRPA